MRCPPRLKRCCAQLLVTGLVAVMLCWIAYLQEPPETSLDLGPRRPPRPSQHRSRNRRPSHPPPLQPTLSRRPVVAIVHQSWADRSLPPMFARWSDTFAACLPGYKRILWTDVDNRELVSRHYPWFLPRYDSLAPGVQRADVSRLFYMHKFGGIYCDLDCECIGGFEHMLVNTSLALGAMEGSLVRKISDPAYVAEGFVENSFMYSQPGHPFFWDLILRINATEGVLPIVSSGTHLIMTGINAARKTGLDRTQFNGLPYLTVYPPHLFNPFSWIRLSNHPNCRPFGDLTQDQMEACRQHFKDTSYILQYHTQVWDKGRGNVLRNSTVR